jgi:hypothetical protein
VPVWILGSSLFGAQLAAMLGLPYAFASHFAPAQMMQAIEIYRATFKPSKQLAKPYVMLGFNVFAADRTNRPRCWPPRCSRPSSTCAPAGRPSCRRRCPATWKRAAAGARHARRRAVVQRHRVTGHGGARDAGLHRAHRSRRADGHLQVFDHQARLRSYELAMGAMQRA